MTSISCGFYRRHKSNLVWCRLTAEDRVAVREAAKAGDHVEIGHAITAETAAAAVLGLAVVRNCREQLSRTLLVGDVLTVVQWHIDELAPVYRQIAIKPLGQRSTGDL